MSRSLENRTGVIRVELCQHRWRMRREGVGWSKRGLRGGRESTVGVSAVIQLILLLHSLITDFRILPQTVTYSEMSADQLIDASRSGNIERVRLLLEGGADVNAVDVSNRSAA